MVDEKKAPAPVEEKAPLGLDEVVKMMLAARDAGAVQRYEKHGQFQFRPAISGEVIVTEIDGEVETKQVAKDGQFVITGPAGETDAIDGTKFGARYQVVSSGLCQPAPGVGEVEAFEYGGDSFTFVAPRGEPMVVNSGDMVATTGTDDDVYRIKRSVFDATYRLKPMLTMFKTPDGKPWGLWAKGHLPVYDFTNAVFRQAEHCDWAAYLTKEDYPHEFVQAYIRPIKSVALTPAVDGGTVCCVWGWGGEAAPDAMPVTAVRW
jgi:hypothetical protein